MPVYKDKDRNTWFVQFVTNENGQKYTFKKRGFKTKKEATNYELEHRTQISSAVQLTVAEMSKIYLEDVSTRLKKSTLLSKKQIFEEYILPQLGATPANKITPAKIIQWQKQLLLTKNASSQIKKAYLNLGAVFHYFIRFKGLKIDPIKNAYCLVKTETEQFNYWTLEDFHAFLKWIEPEQQNPTAYVSTLIIKILFFTGFRWGELAALTKSDIDFVQKTISITKSKNLYGEITPPKTQASIRTIKIPDFLIQDIQAYLDKTYHISNECIFPISQKTIARILRRASKEIPLPYIRIHDLRHSNASLLIHLNYSPAIIKYRLGHRNISTTMDIYAQMYKSEEIKLAKALDVIVNNTETNDIQYPILLQKEGPKLYISFPDFSSTETIEVKSFSDAYRKGHSFLQKKIDYYNKTFQKIPEPSSQYVSKSAQADIVFYVTVQIVCS